MTLACRLYIAYIRLQNCAINDTEVSVFHVEQTSSERTSAKLILVPHRVWYSMTNAMWTTFACVYIFVQAYN